MGLLGAKAEQGLAIAPGEVSVSCRGDVLRVRDILRTRLEYGNEPFRIRYLMDQDITRGAPKDMVYFYRTTESALSADFQSTSAKPSVSR